MSRHNIFHVTTELSRPMSQQRISCRDRAGPSEEVPMSRSHRPRRQRSSTHMTLPGRASDWASHARQKNAVVTEVLCRDKGILSQ